MDTTQAHRVSARASGRQEISARVADLLVQAEVEQHEGGHVITIPLFHKGTNPTVEEKFGRPPLEVLAEDWAATKADFDARKNEIEVDLEHVLIDPEVPPKFRVGVGKLIALGEKDDHYFAKAVVDDETFELVAKGKKKHGSPVYFLKKDAKGAEHPLGLHSVALTSAASIDALPLVAAASIRAGIQISRSEEDQDMEKIDKLEADLAAQKTAFEKLSETVTKGLSTVTEAVNALATDAKKKAEETAKLLAEQTDKVFAEVISEARSQGKVRKGDEAFEIGARAILKEKGLEVLRSHVKAMPVVAPPDGKTTDTKPDIPPTRSPLDTIGEVSARTAMPEGFKPEHLDRHRKILAYAAEQEKAGRKLDYTTALREFGTIERQATA